MLKLEFEIDTTNPIEPDLIKKRNGKLLVDIQGRLEVMVNDRCFFSEPSLALLELGVALKKWNMKQNFNYFTIEHDEREGPILAFIKNGENHWSIFSIWQEFDSKEYLTLKMVSEAAESFLLELDNELKKTYGLGIDDFIKSRWFFGL